MRPEELHQALGFDDIGLLPTDRSFITSRKDVSLETKLSKRHSLKYPLIASPMDTIYSRELCIALNSIGAASVIHRFMSIADQSLEVRVVKAKSGKSYAAISLQDYAQRVPALIAAGVDILYLDIANVANAHVDDFLKWYKENGYTAVDLIIGNTLTKASVRKAITLGAAGIRHGIGIGSVCQTSLMTGIECPPVTALYYAWKALRNYQLEQIDQENPQAVLPSILLDGGVRKPADLVKAIACGADAVISGRIFAGCVETPGVVNSVEGKMVKAYRGMASYGVVEQYKLWDGKRENLFIEGKEATVEYTGKSVIDVVYEFSNGLKSALSYLGFQSVAELKGALWENRSIGIRL